MFETVDEIIDAVGGTGAVTEGLGLKYPSIVSSWRARKSIPGDRWFALADLARERGVEGVTVESLAALHSRPALDEARA